ncbi:unnamed protein product [Arabidopsis arenosa]|uniref:Defensin-like protein n=1 Tax=Arabidopsis arenosa TaxID=38785 RepID=A0A8S2AUZ8_ARAAE|nr:unnamed protein product [Arabidopsis arenosa]
MGSLKLSTVVVTALVVCLSILLISPTEAVEGKLKEECENVPYGFCPFWLFNPRSEEQCKERCQRFKSETAEYYGGFCTPNGPPGGMSFTATCNCCVREKVSPPPEIEAVEGKLEVCENMQIDLCLFWLLPLWWVDFEKNCDEKCQSRNRPGARYYYYAGFCTPKVSPINPMYPDFHGDCNCCIREIKRASS